MVQPLVVGMGAMNLDLLYRVPQLLTEGETYVEESRQAPGGSAANTIYALAKLGVACGFIGAIGDDAEGKTLVADLASVGVDTSSIRVKPGFPTGRVLALIDGKGGRALYALPGANSQLSPQDLDYGYLAGVQWLHFSAFVDEAQLRLQVSLAENLPPETRLSLAPGALYARRGIQALAPLLHHTHTLFLNQAEAVQLTGKPLPQAAQTLLGVGCRRVVVTLGGEGGEVCALYEEGYQQRMPSRIKPRRLVDGTGAGDAFAAGFLFGVLHGKEPGEAARMGEVLAICCLEEMGARAGLPDRSELERRLRSARRA